MSGLAFAGAVIVAGVLASKATVGIGAATHAWWLAGKQPQAAGLRCWIEGWCCILGALGSAGLAGWLLGRGA